MTNSTSTIQDAAQSLPLQVLAQARGLKERMVQIRRYIHSNAELSFEEKGTAAYAASILKELGYTVREGVGGTGVVADIGTGSKAIIGLRADMDGLPIQEENAKEYCSKNAGVMHACGHDAHTASVVGAAKILAELLERKEIDGRFRIILQPAEEMVNSDGLSGASLMMNEGCVDGLSALIGTHVFPGIPTGMLGFRDGTFLAACDSFTIRVIGKGGHGAHPEEAIDAVVLASKLVQDLQTLISRRKSALEPAVLTVGGIRSKTFRPNIISEEVELTGTIRYFRAELSSFFESEIRKFGEALAVQDARMELDYKRENPPLVNDSILNNRIRGLAVEMLGADQIIDVPMELGAEDFSFYTNKVPSLFVVIGAKIEGYDCEFHTARFDINEDALIYASAILAAGAISLSQDSGIKS